MKQIIKGKTYDTETARFIAGSIYPLTCYELYQTEEGEYFKYCEIEQKLWEKNSNPKEIKPCSEEYAQGFIEYATENNMVCTYDVWKRKKRVFKEIQDYVTNHLYNPYKETDWDIITVSERDGYLRIYDTSIFVCIGLEKGDFILDTEDMNYKDIDQVQDIRDHKDIILSMYNNVIKGEK